MTPPKHERALVVGVSVAEREELELWIARRSWDAWFAMSGLEAMRLLDEVDPTVVVIDTLLGDIDPERLARVIRTARPSTRIVFVTNHGVEVPYHAGLTGLGNVGACYRPIDPEEIFGVEGTEESIDGIATRGTANPSVMSGLLLSILRQELSGVLYVGSGPRRRVVYFRGGRPVWVDTRMSNETFGRFLLERGVITPIEFGWARNFQMREQIRQGEALVKIGVLSHADVERLVREQIRMKITRLVRMTGDAYHFDPYTVGPARPRNKFNVIDLVVSGLSDIAAPCPPPGEVRLPLDLGDPVTDELCAFVGSDVVAELRVGVEWSVLETYAGSPERAATLVRVLQSWGARSDDFIAPMAVAV